MKALVTGATGFVGRRLVEQLSLAGASVRVLIRSRHIENGIRMRHHDRVVPVMGDLTAPGSLHDVCDKIDTVFHLAGYAHTSDANDAAATMLHRQITVEGTRILLAEAIRAGVRRFVFASSVKAMGEGSEKCLDETAPALPMTSYGHAKLQAEQIVLEQGLLHGMHVSVIRLPLVYGPSVKGNLIRMIDMIDRGRFPPLPNVRNKRSMVHVRDVVQALILAVEHRKANGEVYLVTDGRAYSTYEIYVLIHRALGRAEPKWSVPIGVLRAGAGIGDVISSVQGRHFFFDSIMLDKLVGSAWYNSDKIERDLGFKPAHTLETALPKMVEEYRKKDGIG